MKTLRLFFSYSLFIGMIWMLGSGGDMLVAQEMEGNNIPQKQKDKSWFWGMKTGFNSSEIKKFSPFMDTIAFDVRDKYGLVFGAFVQYRFTPVLSVEGELLYSSKGGDYRSPSVLMLAEFPNPKDVRFPFRLNYLELPLMLKLHVPSESVQPTFSLGVVPAYAFSTKLVIPVLRDGELVYIKEEWEEAKHMDVAWLVGAGVSLPTNEQKQHILLLELRYIRGTQSITEQIPDSRNSAFNIVLGYSF